jgi:predicted glycosyltransferase
MRVWVDLTNTAHVVVLRPLVERLEAAGHEVVLTARPLSHTLDLLEDWGHPYTALGFHGGASRFGKARAALRRVPAMLAFGRAHGPFDYALAHGSTDLPPACRVLRVANTTMFDYEWAATQHHVNCRLATRVLIPEAIPPERMARYGARPPKLVQYPGLKEDYVLDGLVPDEGVLAALGVDRAKLLVVVRTAPSYALYLGGAEAALLPRLLERLAARDDVATVVLPRNAQQADAVRALGGGLVVPPRAVDARSLVAFADVVVSAGGSMNREAAAIGTPVWTVFEGPLGGVDEMLVRDGRLRVLTDPDQVELVRKPPFQAPFRGRDPEDLLRLAVPVPARA